MNSPSGTHDSRVVEFRLMVRVQQFDAVRDFYRNVLHYSVVSGWNRGPDDRGVLLDTGAGFIELMAAASELELPDNRCEISLGVADVWQLWDRIKDSAPIVFALRHNSWGDTSFCIDDPGALRLTFFTRDGEHR